MTVLLKTIHGSMLYGLSHAGSDEDLFTVVTKKPNTTNHTRKRQASQSIVDGVDSMVVDFGTWMHGCSIGVPQYLEAMFSTAAEVDLIGPLRAGYTVTSQAYDRYLRTIKSFALSEDTGFKKRRHALRLALNLAEIGRYGRFNPTLSDDDIDFINNYCRKSHEDVYGLALCIAYEV